MVAAGEGLAELVVEEEGLGVEVELELVLAGDVALELNAGGAILGVEVVDV